MKPLLATLVCIAGIAYLFYIDRDKTLRTSKALWLPVIWLWIIGSRPVSVWMGVNSAFSEVSVAAEGSPIDAAVSGLLLLSGLIVLYTRKNRVVNTLKLNWACLLYFGYCLFSVAWSDFPALAAKRWIKALADITMVLLIATEADPEGAIGRFIARVGFILMPVSILLIKYYGNLGRGYDPSGGPMNTGVTTYKNSLGVIALVLSFGAMWYFLQLLVVKRLRTRGRLLARGILLGSSTACLVMAHSSTAIACFIVGSVLLLAAYLPMMRRNPKLMPSLVFFILITGGLVNFFGGQGLVVHALGRASNLTGRTAIWAAVLPVVPNVLLGAGFESFWLGPRLDVIYSHLSKYQRVNEAHNGYIEVYLNLGWLGICLIACMLVRGYQGAIGAFRRNQPLGGLLLAYIAAAALYNISEAGYRMLTPMWFFFLFGIICSHRVAAMSSRTAAPARVRAGRGGKFAGKFSSANKLTSTK